MWEFERHFTVDEANALLPSLRRWLHTLRRLDEQLEPLFTEHRELLAQSRNCIGGPKLADYLRLSWEWQQTARLIAGSGVLVKNLPRGLCDFPHLLPETGEEVFLCWELGEDEVGHWHTLDAGYSGRRPLRRRTRS